MKNIQSRFPQFSTQLRMILVAVLLLSGLTFGSSAQATLFGSHTNPDITAWGINAVDTIDSFTANAGFMTLNSNNPSYDQDLILGSYFLSFDKNISFGLLSINGTLLDINNNLTPLGPVNLAVHLTKYDANFGDSQFLGSIVQMDPLLLAAGFDYFKPFGVQFSDYNIQSDNFNTPIPEPSTIILLGAGLLGVVAVSRRKRQ